MGSVLIMRNERLIEAAQNQRPGVKAFAGGFRIYRASGFWGFVDPCQSCLTYR